MSVRMLRLLRPLDLTVLFMSFAVGLSLRMPPDQIAGTWTLLLSFILMFLGRRLCATRLPWLQHVALVLLPLPALMLVLLHPRADTPQILLVIWTVAVATAWPPRVALIVVASADVAVYLILQSSDHLAPLVITLLFACCQGFAALIAHYANSAERTRDQLALVNADLLATRALLADSARDAERLRVARELHDVAGHKLTAMILNLRVLSADPDFAGRNELTLLQQLSRELLGDLRNVVQELRDARGLDLATALHALAAPLPKPRLKLSVDDDVQVTDAATAEALLRLVQEALTNSVRHANAQSLTVALRREGALLHVAIEDDGRLHGPLRAGNGLTGMRERIDALGGTLALSTTPLGALRIDAKLPA